MPSTSATLPAVSLTGAIDPMATEFVLKLDLAETPGNPAAQSAKVCELLRIAGQAIGSDHRQRKGEIKAATWDAVRSTGGHTVTGRWAFQDEIRNPEAEA
jgi:hypothetical protein